MKIRTWIWSLTMVVSAAAGAHAHLEGSVPADKSRVRTPSTIEMRFSEAARLTALTLQRGKDAAIAVKALPDKSATKHSVPVPALAAGTYVVTWRVVSDDGHIMSGTFGFTVDPAAPATTDKPSSTTHDQHQH